MFGFLKHKDEGEKGRGKAAPGTEIYYDPALVDGLKQDHQRLLALYVQLKEQFERGDFVGLAKAMEEFRWLFQEHLLIEKIRLYIYLEHMLAGDTANLELIRHFKQEMDGIGREVTRFLRKYENLESDPALAAGFRRELDQIGNVLNRRIQAEENQLYAFYLPII